MYLVVEEGVWRDVEEVNVGDVVRGFSEWAFVGGDVDPHGGGLDAGEPDGGTVVLEVRASALFAAGPGRIPMPGNNSGQTCETLFDL
jgi:hypothetical protein